MSKKASNNYMKVLFCFFEVYFLNCFLLDAKHLFYGLTAQQESLKNYMRKPNFWAQFMIILK